METDFLRFKWLLQSGQEYYMYVSHLFLSSFFFNAHVPINSIDITVAGNILTMAMIFAPASFPAVFHAIFTVPNIAIGNSMTCHVYHNIKFGRMPYTTIPVHSLARYFPLSLLHVIIRESHIILMGWRRSVSRIRIQWEFLLTTTSLICRLLHIYDRFLGSS